MEIIGFIAICILNLCFSSFCLGWVLVGGFELGNIFTSKSKVDVIACVLLCGLNVYFWTLIIANTPFLISIK